jgi:hypothetical protein
MILLRKAQWQYGVNGQTLPSTYFLNQLKCLTQPSIYLRNELMAMSEHFNHAAIELFLRKKKVIALCWHFICNKNNAIIVGKKWLTTTGTKATYS